MASAFDVDTIRQQFPALARTLGGQPAVFFDGPAGSQVPQSVAEAISAYLLSTNANHEGLFASSRESDAILHAAHQAVADFLGADDPDCIVFGANMTTLTFALSRALSQTWQPGDEIIVTRLDHDANVSPWMLAARDRGVTVQQVDIDPVDCTLRMDDFEAKLSSRTKLVAVGYASNLVGTINPVAEIIEKAHAVGAQVFVDAVHYAPHGLIDAAALDCDFLACSAYKFFGPHVGMLFGKREHLESVEAYKVRPSPQEIPSKWMTGTQNHEGIAGVLAAIDYFAEFGRSLVGDSLGRREAITAAFSAIETYERDLLVRLLDGLAKLSGVKVYGITASDRLDQRVPTVSFTHERLSPTEIAASLGKRGFFTWDGNSYALPLTEALNLEPNGVVRVGLLHYNTAEEVDRLIACLGELFDAR
jgi:cysteine desulfurase family protein (TIGR01976 family)